MKNTLLELYWTELPVGKENAVDYKTLCEMWHKKERETRRILHELSLYDNGDNYVLIRSGKTKGFYKTDNRAEIEAYRKECLNKGRSIFAPIKKCNRILNADSLQFGMFNNLRTVREAKGMTQAEVCKQMKKYDTAFDASLLSKMENGVCLPTFYQLTKLAVILAVEPSELIKWEIPTELLNGAF